MSAQIKFSINGLLNPIKETADTMVRAMENQQQSRTTPIRDSIEVVPGYPVQIYLIPASKHYQARTIGRMNGTRPRISLKTENRATALRAAKDWYNGLLLKQVRGLAKSDHQVCEFATSMSACFTANSRGVRPSRER
jgi:hypothetical protein